MEFFELEEKIVKQEKVPSNNLLIHNRNYLKQFRGYHVGSKDDLGAEIFLDIKKVILNVIMG